MPPPSNLPRPIIIDAPAGPVFGFYHAPSGGAQAREGVLLCPPLGYESVCSQLAYRELASRLASAGFAALRFDYHGTGDSGGDDRDPRRVEAMCGSIEAAMAALRSLSGAGEISLFGVRMGATLAMRAAAEAGGVKKIAAWAPCVSGSSYLREMRAFHKMTQRSESPPARSVLDEGDVEAGGYLMTKETVAALCRLNLLELARSPAPDILIIPREDIADDARLAASLRRGGANVFEEKIPGYSSMMVDQLSSTMPHRVLDAVVRWFSGRAPGGATGTPRTAAAATSSHMRIRPRGSDSDVDERPVYFGSGGGLFGILSERAERAERARTAALFLSVGLIARSGPNRLYTRFARHWAGRGVTCLRIDLAGIGDSRGEGTPEELMFSESAVRSVREAMDFLRTTRSIDRFILVGLCSGAYVAFHAGLRIESVLAEILLNPAPLHRKLYREEVRYYMGALFRKESWKKASRGEVDFRRIFGLLPRRALSVVKETAAKARSLARGSSARGDLLRMFRETAERGIDTLLVFRPNDAGLRFIEERLEIATRDLRGPKLRLEIIAGADHIFSPLWSQDYLLDLLTDHLFRLIET